MKFGKKKTTYSAALHASPLHGHFDEEQLILMQITKHKKMIYL